MANKFKTLDDLKDCRGRTVLIRGDLNVPFKNGKVTDDSRLQALLPTLGELSEKGARIILISHFGRPEGQRDMGYSLKPIAAHLKTLTDIPVNFADDCIGSPVKSALDALNDGDILMCENLRFHTGETNNDADFAKALSTNADIYINDAFSAAHRAHASTVGVTEHLPAYAGRLMEKELTSLASILNKPETPVAAIVGGSKISTKLDVLKYLVKKTDFLIIGGAMANTFLYAQGHDVGKSLHETDMNDSVDQILKSAEKNDCTVYIPSDVTIAKNFEENAPHENKACDNLAADDMALDLGPKSVADIKSILNECHTLLWNGPLGAFETKPFDQATNEVAQFAAERTKNGNLYSVGGGGDTVSALEQAGIKQDFSYISTAGGAFLEFIEGKVLPGVDALY